MQFGSRSYNDERVVRAIGACEIPIIAGIGHQRDESLADLAADICAHTPTAAAQLAVPDLQDLADQHQQRCQALQAVMRAYWQQHQSRNQHQRQRLQRVGMQQILQRETQQIVQLRQRLQQAVQQQWQRDYHRYQLLAERLQGLDPQAILNRGYAIVCQEDGSIVRQPQALASGDVLTLYLAAGQCRIQVQVLPD